MKEKDGGDNNGKTNTRAQDIFKHDLKMHMGFCIYICSYKG